MVKRFEVESNMCWHVLTFNSWRNAGPHAWLFKRAASVAALTPIRSTWSHVWKEFKIRVQQLYYSDSVMVSIHIQYIYIHGVEPWFSLSIFHPLTGIETMRNRDETFGLQTFGVINMLGRRQFRPIPPLDRPARLTIKVLWFLFLIYQIRS